MSSAVVLCVVCNFVSLESVRKFRYQSLAVIGYHGDRGFCIAWHKFMRIDCYRISKYATSYLNSGIKYPLKRRFNQNIKAHILKKDLPLPNFRFPRKCRDASYSRSKTTVNFIKITAIIRRRAWSLTSTDRYH